VAQAASEAKLSFKVPGTLTQLHVAVGDSVERGQRLARLDATDLALKRDEAHAGKSQAEAQLHNSEAQHARAATLYESDSASRQNLDGARLARDSARANLQAATRRLQLAEARVGYAQLTAPAAGRVAQVSAEVGENLREGMPILTLNTGDAIEVEISVPESVIGAVQSGDAASVSFAALDGESFAATVTEVGVAVAERGAAYPVTLRVDGDSGRIRSGMAARASLQVSTGLGPGVVVPSKAVSEDRSGRFAWVAVPAEGGLSVVHRKSVKTSGVAGDGIVVTAGLRPGDAVITAGLTYLQEDMRVVTPSASKRAPRAARP
jgi:RND family efflux transporter MFP subunit